MPYIRRRVNLKCQVHPFKPQHLEGSEDPIERLPGRQCREDLAQCLEPVCFLRERGTGPRIYSLISMGGLLD